MNFKNNGEINPVTMIRDTVMNWMTEQVAIVIVSACNAA